MLCCVLLFLVSIMFLVRPLRYYVYHVVVGYCTVSL